MGLGDASAGASGWRRLLEEESVVYTAMKLAASEIWWSPGVAIEDRGLPIGAPP